jgi:poly-beta-1,6-N-acetyl-D-glucosamine biosynthesis protein PgaD
MKTMQREAFDSRSGESSQAAAAGDNNAGIAILDFPDLKGALRNMGEWSFTTFMWILWGYLFLPLLNILLWLIGVGHFYATIIVEAHYHDVMAMARQTGWLVIVVFLLLRGWGLYNYYRFGKSERRISVSPASTRQLAEFFGVAEDTVLQLRDQKEVIWEGCYERS